jgi:glucose repression regulatory protein TUP1
MHDGSSTVLTINDPDSLNNDAGVTSVAISPDGRWVAAGSLDTVVRIWEVATGKLVERLRGHRDSVYSVAFTPDGRGLVSGSLDKTLKYWDVSALGGGPAGVGASASAASGAGKGKKEGAAASAAASAVAVGGGGSSSSRKEEKASPCTMNFTGHKVRFFFPVLFSHSLTPSL